MPTVTLTLAYADAVELLRLVELRPVSEWWSGNVYSQLLSAFADHRGAEPASQASTAAEAGGS